MSNEVKRKFPLKLNLQLFAEPTDPPADPQDPPSDPTVPKKLEMTQEEFDAKIEERLARERKKYAGFDEMKTKLAELEKAEEDRQKASMTEKERLEAERDEALKKVDEAEDKSAKALESANQRLIKAEFRLIARSADVNIRSDALDAAFRLADFSAVKVDEDGNVIGVKEAATSLITSNPYLVDTSPTKPKTIGEPTNPATDEIKTLEAQLDEARKRKDFSKVVELSNKIQGLKK